MTWEVRISTDRDCGRIILSITLGELSQKLLLTSRILEELGKHIDRLSRQIPAVKKDLDNLYNRAKDLAGRIANTIKEYEDENSGYILTDFVVILALVSTTSAVLSDKGSSLAEYVVKYIQDYLGGIVDGDV